MPTIRVDDDVYSWLKSQAVPFEDTPNSVLRRFAGLDKDKGAVIESTKDKKMGDKMITAVRTSGRRWTGKVLNDLWEVHARHALYHKDGTWYETLIRFPGALFDDNGYILFRSEKEYKECPYLSFGLKVNVHNGISSIPGYKRMEVK
jgi:5-methylcytosine-specific restriction protein A